MSFSSIPADLLLTIFNLLPFKDRVRLRGVNRLFREVSEKSINSMRSLEINDDVMSYALSTQFFSFLLESCSPILESIDVTNRSLNKCVLITLTESVYPKLEHLAITVTNDALAKKLISRNQNLRSISIYLNREFEWPEDVVFEKLEKLEIIPSDNCRPHFFVDLSPTWRSLIGKVPNLKRLTVQRNENGVAVFKLSVQEFGQLLSTSPRLQELKLFLTRGFYNAEDLEAAMQTWYLPNLTSLAIAVDNQRIPSSILHIFLTSFPALNSFMTSLIEKIDDQAVMALSHLEQLRELRLPKLAVSKAMFTEMVKMLPSIAVLEIDCLLRGEEIIPKFDDQIIPALSQLQYLRELCLPGETRTEDEIIDLIINVPSLAILKIYKISCVRSPETLIGFLMSPAMRLHRNLEIHLGYNPMYSNGTDMGLEQMKAILEEMKTNGGPVVEMHRSVICMIRYGP